MKLLPAAVMGAALALLVAGEALFVHGHHPTGTHAAIGVVGCLVVVLLAKAAGRAFLQEPEEKDDV